MSFAPEAIERKPLKVLYVGPLTGTSLHRRNAFLRLGHEVTVIEPRKLLPVTQWIDRVEWHVAPEIPAAMVQVKLRALLRDSKKFDLAFVDNGSVINRESVGLLRKCASVVVNFNHDDPFGMRDFARFRVFRKAVVSYDLLTVVRKVNVLEAERLGARDVLLHPMVSDEIAHAPRQLSPDDSGRWSSAVAFIGSWMPERGTFLVDLIKRGVPLSIYGPLWNKSPEWKTLAPYHRADYLDGDDYAYAVQGALISLGLLSKGNRDLHTTRSMEIPSFGGLLCAERTSDHLAFYVEGREAVFWETSEECADVCIRLLENKANREEIARRGHNRHMVNGFTSENLLRKIIARTGLNNG